MAMTKKSGKSTASWDTAELARTTEGKALLDRHLIEITTGTAFKGSQRSAQFLEYIVQQSSLGHMERLKERSIGIDLFGRVPSYDTSEDAIVRVTATDVRRRLSQHYSRERSESGIRIQLLPGTYVPEIIRDPSLSDEVKVSPAGSETPTPPEAAKQAVPPEKHSSQRTLLFVNIVLLAMVLVLAGLAWRWRGQKREPAGASAQAPWQSVVDGARPTLIIASDPNVEEIQRLSHSSLDLSDYANQHYLPHDAEKLSPMQLDFMKNILRGNKISSVDGGIIANLAFLATQGSFRPTIKGARDIRTADLETNNNLVFLGSPRSNPWTSLYEPQLDFRFAFDEQTRREFIRNAHPAQGEKSEYTPSAGGFDTGDSYATISVLQNPGHNGRVLIVAGTNAEATEAAGSLVTDTFRWDTVLQACHLAKPEPNQPLQLLLQMGTMAGAANHVTIVSCHLLNGASHS